MMRFNFRLTYYQILITALLSSFIWGYCSWVFERDLVSSKAAVAHMKTKVDSLTHAIAMVRDSAAEDQDSQIQSNALWWMHRCEEDAAAAKASADSAMRAAVRGFRRRSQAYWCECEMPLTSHATPALRRDSTLTLPADQVGGPSLY